MPTRCSHKMCRICRLYPAPHTRLEGIKRLALGLGAVPSRTTTRNSNVLWQPNSALKLKAWLSRHLDAI